MKRIKWGLILVLLSLMLVPLSACGSQPGTSESQPIKVVRGNLAIMVNGSGKIEVSNEAKLVFSVGGRIDEIPVKEGDEVTKGQVLAKLETDSLEIAVTQAEVALTQARAAQKTAEDSLSQAQDKYSEAEILQARQAVSSAEQAVRNAQSKLDQATLAYDITVWTNELAYAKERLRIAQTTLDQMLTAPDPVKIAIAKLNLEAAQQSVKLAEQSLAQTKKQLSEATIAAPFDGIVAAINAEEGDFVATPSLLAPSVIIHLIDTRSMELKVQVDEIDVPGLKIGQKAIIEVDALPTLKLEGKVSFISPLSVEEGGVLVYDVTIEFTVPEDSGIRTGMSATADIVITERENVLLIPDRVVTQDSQGKTVVKVLTNGQAVERPVSTGISDGFQTEVISGLEEGETVVRQ
ncbi:MAG: efflux RND transporter periplasmic adaptor subunit [Chloroflexota bacterium]